MTRLVWLGLGAAGGWFAAVAAGLPKAEVAWGIGGPLVAAAVSWIVMERTFRRNPARMTGVMSQSLLVKLAFFAAYVVLGVKGLALDSTLFVSSLAASFMVFHVVETIWLRRLLTSGVSATR